MIDKAKCKEIVEYLKKKVDSNGTLELTVDIECSHNDVKTYGTGKQYVKYDQIIRERNIIMIQFAHVEAKSPGKVFTLEWDWTRFEDRDRNLLEEFVYILNHFEDLIIHSKNGVRFDVPYITGRLFLLQLPEMPCFEHKDLELLIRKNMYLNSYALDYISKKMTGRGKIKMDREIWINIEEHGSEKDMNQMRRYGKKDVVDTNIDIEKAARYIPELRAYCNIKASGGYCHHCKAKHMLGKLEKRGFKRSLSGKRQIWHCTNKRHPRNKPAWFVEQRVQRYD